MMFFNLNNLQLLTLTNLFYTNFFFVNVTNINSYPKITKQLSNSQATLAQSGSAIANCKRVCYFRMDPKTEINLSQVDGSLCTHVILAFFRIDSKGNLDYGNKETDIYYLKEVNQFKTKWPNVKVMISIYNEPEYNGFHLASMDIEIRKNFARSSIEFLNKHNLDGIDLDWEFPNFPNTFRSREYERIGLTKIVQALRSAIVENFFDRQVAELNSIKKTEAFQNHSSTNNTLTSQVEPYLLTIAIAGQESILKASYQLKQLANLADWFNVMSYDYYLFKSYIPFTGPNSPLHPIVNPQVPVLSKLGLSWTLQRLLSQEYNVPGNKIVMGIPTYARAFRLLFKQPGGAKPSPFTLSVGSKGGQIEDYLNYREVCDILERPDTIVEFDERARVPYCLAEDGYTWISYENVQSVREKVRFILTNQLAGYMTWNLNSDDFTGKACPHLSTTNSHYNQQQQQQQQQQNAQLNSLEPTFAGQTFPLHRAMLFELTKFYELTDNNNNNNNNNNISYLSTNLNSSNQQSRYSIA